MASRALAFDAGTIKSLEESALFRSLPVSQLDRRLSTRQLKMPSE